MDLQDLIATVGDQRYGRARRLAWATAAERGGSHHAELGPELKAEFDRPYQDPETHELTTVREDACQVMYDLGADIWESNDLSRIEMVQLTFQLYRDMPNSSPLWLVCFNRPRPGDPSYPASDDYLDALWTEMRALLQDGDDRLAQPVENVLWAEWFEVEETGGEAWSQLVEQGDLNDAGMQRLLRVSGPVPYERKAALYDRLRDPKWHPWIFWSLVASCRDYFGQTDHAAALRVVSRLKVPEDMRPAVEAFKEHLRTPQTPMPKTSDGYVTRWDVVQWERERDAKG